MKVKISALWNLLGFSLTLVFTLKDFDPSSNGLAHMLVTLPAQHLPRVLLGDAAVRLTPFVFAVLSLTLKGSLNRRMNLFLGLVFSVFALSGMVTLLAFQLSVSSAYLVLAQVTAIAAPVLIFKYAYMWPR